ncbi:hypothetical protein JW905_01595 [bacterium]|nr:hypothetical protein [candidate division CSSED10-310 bacterium]
MERGRYFWMLNTMRRGNDGRCLSDTHRSVRRLAPAVFLMMVMITRPAAVGAWQQLPLYGGEVRDLAGDGQSTYIATYGGGVFFSTNAGAVWQPCNESASQRFITALALASDGALFAAGHDGLSRRTAGGSWEHALHQPLSDVAVHPESPETVWTGGWGSGLLRSTDGGITFQGVRAGFDSWAVAAITIAPSDPQRIFIGTCDRGIYRSTDGGATFTNCSTGLNHLHAADIAVDPGDPTRVYAAANEQVRDISSSAGLYVSTDGGTTWLKRLDELHLLSVAVDPVQPSTILCGSHYDSLFLSTDSGTSWNLTYFNRNDNRIHMVRSAGTFLYAGNGSGVAGSIDHGITWTPLNTGLRAVRCRDIALNPGNADIMTLATYGAGMMRSLDGGAGWSYINAGISYGPRHFLCVDTNCTNGNELYAGSEGFWLWKSSDGGASWRSLGTSGWITASCLDVSDASPNLVFAGTILNGMYRSTDSGATWQLIQDGIEMPNFCTVKCRPDVAATAIVGTFNGYHYITSDAGATWTRINYNDTVWRRTTLFDVAFTGNGATFYLATSAGMYVTHDGGASFIHDYSHRTTSFRSVWVHPGNPQLAYAGGWSTGIYLTENGGVSWSSVPGGPMVPVTAITHRSLEPLSLLILTDGEGIFTYP